MALAATKVNIGLKQGHFHVNEYPPLRCPVNAGGFKQLGGQSLKTHQKEDEIKPEKLPGPDPDHNEGVDIGVCQQGTASPPEELH